MVEEVWALSSIPHGDSHAGLIDHTDALLYELDAGIEQEGSVVFPVALSFRLLVVVLEGFGPDQGRKSG